MFRMALMLQIISQANYGLPVLSLISYSLGNIQSVNSSEASKAQAFIFNLPRCVYTPTNSHLHYHSEVSPILHCVIYLSRSFVLV